MIKLYSINEITLAVKNLLLLADPEERIVDKYINESEIYGVDFFGEVIAVLVLQEIEKDLVEVKNIVVDPRFEGMGIGRSLIQYAEISSKAKSARTLEIKTADTSVRQLKIYQKAGFEISERKKNFFLDHYTEPIFENGIQCKDQVVLRKPISSDAGGEIKQIEKLHAYIKINVLEISDDSFPIFYRCAFRDAKLGIVEFTEKSAVIAEKHIGEFPLEVELEVSLIKYESYRGKTIFEVKLPYDIEDHSEFYISKNDIYFKNYIDIS